MLELGTIESTLAAQPGLPKNSKQPEALVLEVRTSEVVRLGYSLYLATCV